MPTLFIHTGLHKTGTTSLQKAFFDNRRVLARQGLLYPDTGLSPNPGNWGHHELALALRQQESGEALWQALRAEADASGLDRVLVSSETLSHLPYPRLPNAAPYRLIARIFAGYEIRVVTYLRPQADMIAALYRHNVKATGERRDLFDCMAQMAPRLEYQHYLNTIALGLGDAAITLRRYLPDQLVAGDVIADMAALTGIDLGDGFRPLEAPRNPGLSAEGLAAMLAANRRLADAPEALRRERLRIVKAHPARAFERHDLLSDETRHAIWALYRRKNAQIAQRFLGIAGDLFPPEPAWTAEGAVSGAA
ncbi:hypothetical protein M4578_24035 [Salipiger sp. P9]|uniref:hypothetical protein n=1 Tax=Salipiger pentaromativorans TaxID=2943193 RepID=UPI002157FED0|nr:hypothetical protein [Salipiger pentaromativorans]MCR8550908.1 hypothetical protein [Salipiger pentaromativorans]